MHVESEPTMIMPGEIGQVFHAFDLPVTIEGFATEEGALVTQVIAGKGEHRPEAPAQRVEGLNLPLPGGSFAIALVKNGGDTPRAIKGTWTLRNEETRGREEERRAAGVREEAQAASRTPQALSEPLAASEQPPPEIIVKDGVRYVLETAPTASHTPQALSDPWSVPANAASTVAPPQTVGPSTYTVPNPPQPPTPAVYVDAPAVANVARTAGANEVAIYLTIGEVSRLADVIAAGRTIEQGERWGIVRKLRAAIGK